MQDKYRETQTHKCIAITRCKYKSLEHTNIQMYRYELKHNNQSSTLSPPSPATNRLFVAFLDRQSINAVGRWLGNGLATLGEASVALLQPGHGVYGCAAFLPHVRKT